MKHIKKTVVACSKTPNPMFFDPYIPDQEVKLYTRKPFPPCGGCGCGIRDVTMLHNRIWKSICKGDRYLCYSCMERRLGRLITTKDLKLDPNCNSLTLYLLTRIEQCQSLLPPSSS